MSAFTDLLKSEIQLFIKEYQGVTTDLLLKSNVFTEVTNKELVQQIPLVIKHKSYAENVLQTLLVVLVLMLISYQSSLRK